MGFDRCDRRAGRLCHTLSDGTAAARYGTTAKNKNTAKMAKWTMPWSTVVRPVPSAMMLIKRVNVSKISSFSPSPSVMGWWSTTESTATAGIVTSILARAERKARFKLVCNRLARAARMAVRHPCSFHAK
jgi:hypothetical protein